ncbi:hypothetical protein AURDEDRAFT_188855 [Auricularia subglabra TFB-10046 SS5]|uniref:MYND-type domain-containing protein n=1 Tax=Auricularia subglabra (strain TFB-10046 / SS5) TaxID=717982 RepID=J0WS94_AURST|nr:hypothetical protein AURDEDRAFT_188855 [Auricularia subglabra TFB-10046 SS5]
MSFVGRDWTELARASASRTLVHAHSCCPKCASTGLLQPAFDYVCVGAATALHCALAEYAGMPSSGTAFTSRRPGWPRSLEDLFPGGTDRTLNNLLDLVDADITVEVTVLDLLSGFRPFVLPFLATPDHRARIIGKLVARVRTATSAISSDLAKIRPPVLPTVHDRVTEGHTKPIEHLVELLLCVFAHPDRETDDGPMFVVGREPELFGVLNALIERIRDPLATDDPLVRLVGLIWGGSPDTNWPPTGRPDMPPYVSEYLRRKQTKQKDPYIALRSSLLEQTTRRSCHACRKPVHEKETSGGFARCANCRAVRYCSRQCQRADWSLPAYPHKDVCGMLRELFGFADMLTGEEKFALVCAAHAFPLGHVDKLIEWARNREAEPGVKTVSNYASGEGVTVVEAHPTGGVLVPELNIVVGKNTKIIRI